MRAVSQSSHTAAGCGNWVVGGLFGAPRSARAASSRTARCWPKNRACGGTPRLADRGVELPAVGAGLDLGEPSAPQVDLAGRAVEVAAQAGRDSVEGLVVLVGQRDPGLFCRDDDPGGDVPVRVGRAASEGAQPMPGRPADILRLAVADRSDGADVGAIGEYAQAAQTRRVGLRPPETPVHRAQSDRT